ncbi:pumilio family mRNA-binding protein [Grosmannia clavigera kw1407]|uniref:Pumilio homology domain family member 3 n=1 Tax=Grosmannia clavigera (strain kw1407 / UAMH 11150) TaxID=655863 RepID=F0XUA6_GROCL|nr:pumilio family mRNA-binding protein [Grosmannia clavigera kw1407]EFW98695.1 pumilio family mRNA-binding protein [Grosmannia clavigera kw1407]
MIAADFVRANQAQSSRFTSYGKANSRDVSSSSASSQQRNSFSSNWSQPNTGSLWATHIPSPFANRDSQTSLSGHDEAFSSSSDAANTFPDASAVWPHPGAHTTRSWNSTDNTASRRPSASPSPVHMRESSQTYHEHLHDRTPSTTNASYLAVRTSSGSYAPSRPSAGPSLDSNAAPFRFPPPRSSLRNGIVDVDGEASVASSYPSFGFDTEPLPQQDLANGFSNASATATGSGSSISTSVAAPVPGAANSGIATSIASLSSFGSMPPSSHNGHARRPSLQAQASFSSPAPSTSQLPHQRQPQSDDAVSLAFADLMMRQTLNAEDRQDIGAGLTGTYPASTPFEYNPVSQTWDATDPLRAANFAAARGTLAGLNRGVTPVGNQFRQATGQRGFGAPANGTDQWGRPVSRDLRAPGSYDGFNCFNSAMGLLPRPSPNSLTQEGLQQLQQSQLQILYQQQLHPQQQFTGAPSLFPTNFSSNVNAFRTPVANPQLSLHSLGVQYIAPNAQVPRDRDPAQAFRSPLLDEYRASRTSRRFELKDIYDHIVEFSGDQHGSRFIQSKLETANSDEKEHVFREISANTLVLMQDVFGNYVVQKFFEHGSQLQKKYLAEQMRGKIVDLSTQTYACRVVQKALQHILVDQQVILAKELEIDVIRVVKDPNGNHVIQKVVELVPREHINFIIDAFRGRVRELSAHNYGCRVIQRMLEHGLEEDKEMILSELHDNAMDLINDQYGNYVAQHVIQFGKPRDREKVISRVLNQLVTMSNNKFASNVVEKCIEFGTAADRQRIREELSRLGPDGQPILQQMIKDQYGNYVIQKLLKQLKGEEHQLFAEVLSVQLSVLRRSSTGRQNAAIDRLATAMEETSKGNNASGQAPSGKKPNGDSASQASPQLSGDQESTPSLASLPTTPESSNPPSVSAGSSGGSLESEDNDSTATAKAVDARENAACLETQVV